MTEKLASVGNQKAKLDHSWKQTVQQPRSSHEQEQSALLKRNDKVSLDKSKAADRTYGPIPGVSIGTPYELLRSLVIKTLQEQGAALQIDTGSEILDLQAMPPEQARELISEDGYLGVEQTSQRIVDFAINNFGNDPEKLAEMKAAIEDGFQQAAEIFGGRLPEISQQTYDAIMEKLDAFAKGEEPQTED